MHANSDAHLFLQLAEGQPVPYADLQQWARAGLRKIACGQRVDAALRLDRPQRVRQRNRHLYTAWQILAADGADDWQVAGKLSQAISRHEATFHKRFLLGADSEANNELDIALHFAFCSGAGMMRCQRKLYEHFQSTG